MVSLSHKYHEMVFPENDLSSEDSAFLNNLRFVAMACRAKPRVDLFEACALLQVTRGASQEAHAEVLMRCLGEALGQPAKLRAPGEAELTFDERWLLGMGRAAVFGDELSLTFLLGRRIKPEHRRFVRFLVVRIAGQFFQT